MVFESFVYGTWAGEALLPSVLADFSIIVVHLDDDAVDSGGVVAHLPVAQGRNWTPSVLAEMARREEQLSLSSVLLADLAGRKERISLPSGVLADLAGRKERISLP